MASELRKLLSGRVTVVWFVLIAATAVSWVLGTNHGIDARLATTLVLCVTFVKVGLVGFHFMEIREAVVSIRVAAYAYCSVVCAILIALYLGGS